MEFDGNPSLYIILNVTNIWLDQIPVVRIKNTLILWGREILAPALTCAFEFDSETLICPQLLLQRTLCISENFIAYENQILS